MEEYQLIINKIDEKPIELNQMFSNKSEATLITFCNPFSFQIIKKNSNFQLSLEAMNHVYADGILLCKLLKLKGKKVQRLSFDGNSIAPAVFQYCSEKNKKIALIGGNLTEILNATEKIKNQYDLNIDYIRNGYFNNRIELLTSQDEIINKNIDVVIIGMGSPLQEQYLIDLKNKGFKGVGFTCGGYITQIASKNLEYYPKFVNKFNLRAFYRLYKEPKRLFSRYTLGYANFYKYFVKSIFIR